MVSNHLLQERVSYVASITKSDADKDGAAFKDANTPLDLEDGALREGGALNYSSPEVLVLLFQYAVVGVCIGGIGGMKLPVLTYYFGLESATISAASGLMSLGWSFKVFYGMLSDCFPIMGYSRKPYILLGWTLTAICFVIIALKPAGDAVNGDSSAEDIKSAQSHGSLLALLCAVACFCYIMADVACDAMVVEYAQREPDHVRGRLQSSAYATRYIFNALITGVSGFCMSSPRFGGTFSFDVSVNAYFWIMAVPCVVNVVLVFFFMKDRKRAAVNRSTYFAEVFNLIQQRAVLQVMVFSFMFNLFSSGIMSLAGNYIQVYWAKVEPVNSSIATVLTYVVFSGTLFAVGKWGTNWNWRLLLVITTLSASCIDAVAQFLTIYNIVRNQWFYLGIPLTEYIPLGIQFVVTTFVIVELAGDGNEGLTYGLLTTVGNLPSVFGTMITNVYSTQLRVAKADIKTDTPEVRRDAAYSYMIVYATTIIACCWTIILPPQKAAVKELLLKGGKYPMLGAAMIVAMFSILCLSVTSTLLSMFESTQCYLLAGGSGCD
ncbi:hypothetical protein H310_12949 [Aphanomyces invadans]|uniref:Folate-Biopterin Transporter (FBT) Family n=1 Tax=Aphanomyces invadans TaxID=157072 RepID=A0A024TI10_9STRA|nr:hypothetical protein H310_12949 [Aphanomyces invadans]ETV92952.1 hypothetical protein H310_12949 [Aphanomyces invadans]|eukprot:XP_008878473.1 hypothetical protein H310_12949 [Aphanomyces invadans]